MGPLRHARGVFPVFPDPAFLRRNPFARGLRHGPAHRAHYDRAGCPLPGFSREKFPPRKRMADRPSHQPGTDGTSRLDRLYHNLCGKPICRPQVPPRQKLVCARAVRAGLAADRECAHPATGYAALFRRPDGGAAVHLSAPRYGGLYLCEFQFCHGAFLQKPCQLRRGTDAGGAPGLGFLQDKRPG